MNDYEKISEAINYIRANKKGQPSLDEISEHIGLSPHHFQKLFKRWAGVSPKRFLQYLTVNSAKEILRTSASVLDTAFEVGLSGPSRLHDLFIHTEAVTPGQYKTQGEGITIRYGFHSTPFGTCLLAQTDKGICHLSFDEDLSSLKENWQSAELIEDSASGADSVQNIFYNRNSPLHLHLKGTNFQIKVWRALLEIPEGCLTTYSRIADHVCSSKATRAVGTAIGRNPIGYLIPCHRVLRITGEPGGYRWGLDRKNAMIAREVSTANPPGT